MGYLRKVEISRQRQVNEFIVRTATEITTSNEKFTIKENGPKESMFRRRPQNRLKENIIIKQRNDEKQGWAHLGVDKI